MPDSKRQAKSNPQNPYTSLARHNMLQLLSTFKYTTKL